MASKTQKRKEDKVKQEIIVKARSEGLNKTEAYMKAFPKSSYDTARNEAPQYIKRHGLDELALQRMAEAGLTEGDLFNKLKGHVNGDDARISFDATKHALGMIGYGKEQKEANASYNPVQINIIIDKQDTQPIDAIDVKAE